MSHIDPRYCRDYLHGSCDRANCRYEHATVAELMGRGEDIGRLIFCRDFQRSNCFRPLGTCRFIHATTYDEQFYRSHKILPPHLMQNLPTNISMTLLCPIQTAGGYSPGADPEQYMSSVTGMPHSAAGPPLNAPPLVLSTGRYGATLQAVPPQQMQQQQHAPTVYPATAATALASNGAGLMQVPYTQVGQAGQVLTEPVAVMSDYAAMAGHTGHAGHAGHAGHIVPGQSQSPLMNSQGNLLNPVAGPIAPSTLHQQPTILAQQQPPHLVNVAPRPPAHYPGHHLHPYQAAALQPAFTSPLHSRTPSFGNPAGILTSPSVQRPGMVYNAPVMPQHGTVPATSTGMHWSSTHTPSAAVHVPHQYAAYKPHASLPRGVAKVVAHHRTQPAVDQDTDAEADAEAPGILQPQTEDVTSKPDPHRQETDSDDLQQSTIEVSVTASGSHQSARTSPSPSSSGRTPAITSAHASPMVSMSATATYSSNTPPSALLSPAQYSAAVVVMPAGQHHVKYADTSIESLNNVAGHLGRLSLKDPLNSSPGAEHMTGRRCAADRVNSVSSTEETRA
eukprot:scpid26428/ scgid8102/ Zinc finger CCCH domain-containing protein 10